ncbi:MAG: 50S ribosomal protein L4 [Armatimonadetes bacterium]|nr:MAG: 50S ribosomal protein L4 [Armatimonadota bacterium]
MSKESTKNKTEDIKIKKEKSPKVTLAANDKKAKGEGVSVPVFSIEGTENGSMTLPGELFDVKVNKALLSQALRVSLANQKTHFANTKTRGQVKGSTRKIRAQKGTGGARHGSIRAPIFVGGGIALGPTFRKTILDLPKKMKKAALIAALSAKTKEGGVMGLEGIDRISGKTKQVQEFLSKIAKKEALFVLGTKEDKVLRAVRNLKGTEALLADQLNLLAIATHKTLMFTKEAVDKLEIRITKEISGRK